MYFTALLLIKKSIKRTLYGFFMEIKPISFVYQFFATIWLLFRHTLQHLVHFAAIHKTLYKKLCVLVP